MKLQPPTRNLALLFLANQSLVRIYERAYRLCQVYARFIHILYIAPGMYVFITEC